MLKNLLASGYPGTLLAVNPRGGDRVHDVQCFDSIASIHDAPDLAIVCTSPTRIPSIVDVLGRKGVHAVLIIMGGLAGPVQNATGTLGQFINSVHNLLGLQLESGQTLLEATWEAAQPFDMRIMGPNCIGTIMPRNRLNASYAHCMVQDGNVAYVGQSGVLALAIMDWAKGRDLGFSCVTSLGDSVDIDIADVLEFLAEDVHTRAILLQIEQLRCGSRFVSALRAASRSKLVIVMKNRRVSESQQPPEQIAAALVDGDITYDAVFRRAGALRVERTDEVFSALESLTRMRRLHGERLAVICNGIGPAFIAVDHLILDGGQLAKPGNETAEALSEILLPIASVNNPVDISASGTPQHLAGALDILLRDREVDAILVLHVPTLIAPSRATAEAVAGVARKALKPVLTSWMGHENALSARAVMDAANVSTFDTPEQAIDAYMHMIKYRRNQEQLDQVPHAAVGMEQSGIDSGAIWALVGHAQHENREQLSQAESVLLLSSAGILVVEAQLVDGLNSLQLSMGITRDPVFGPLIFFGKGGEQYTATVDIQVGLPPLNLNLARMLIDSTANGRWLTDQNHESTVYRDKLAEMLVTLSRLVIEVPAIEELYINPLVVNREGILVMGATVTLGERCELAILPYPSELEENITLTRTGRRVMLRPIKGEDAPAHAAFGSRLSPEAIRYRFFGPRSGFTQHQLAQFTQIDYAREMAFIASAENSEGISQTLGVVRTWTDPDNVAAEFAIIVDDSLRGEGLGYCLLQKMISYIRQRGTLEIRGTVLSDNQPMRKLAKKLGFSSRYSPSDGARVVSLRLNEPTDEWQRERLTLSE